MVGEANAASPVSITADQYTYDILEGEAVVAILTIENSDTKFRKQEVYIGVDWPNGVYWNTSFKDTNGDEIGNEISMVKQSYVTIKFYVFCDGPCQAGDVNTVLIYARTDPRFYSDEGNVTDTCGSDDCETDTTPANQSTNLTNTIDLNFIARTGFMSSLSCDTVSSTGGNEVTSNNTTLWAYTLTNTGWNDDFYQFTSVVTSADGHNVGYWIVDPGMADGRGLAGHNASAADGVITIVPANNATSGVYNIELAVISVNGAPTAGCNFDVVVPETETEEETKEPYLEVSGMDENHYNGSYVVSNQTFGGRPILVHENENADTTYIFYHSEREEWIIQPVEPSDEWNAHMIGKGDVWDPAEAIWDNDNYTMVLEWIGGNPTSDWHDDESGFCPAEITDENNDTIDDNCLAVFDDPEESDIVEEVVPSVSLISAIAILGTIVIFRRN